MTSAIYLSLFAQLNQQASLLQGIGSCATGGAKHKFFAAFSKSTEVDGRDVRNISSSDVTSSPAPMPPASRRGGGSVPVILQPSAPSARATTSARATMASTLREESLAKVPVPQGRTRVVFDLEAPAGTKTPSAAVASLTHSQREPPRWFTGPFKDGGRMSYMHDTIERMTNRQVVGSVLNSTGSLLTHVH